LQISSVSFLNILFHKIAPDIVVRCAGCARASGPEPVLPFARLGLVADRISEESGVQEFEFLHDLYDL
jgi:hypothetical protein